MNYQCDIQFVQNSIKGNTTLSEKFETEIHTMFKLVIFFNADDTVIFSENPDDLKKTTKPFFSEYCVL